MTECASCNHPSHSGTCSIADCTCEGVTWADPGGSYPPTTEMAAIRVELAEVRRVLHEVRDLCMQLVEGTIEHRTALRQAELAIQRLEARLSVQELKP